MTSELPSKLHVGTQSWSCDDWVGVFYPEGTRSIDYITEYARHHSCVEIDSTFYRIPSMKTVDAWKEKTPDDFVFAAKMPQVITHEKFLADCQEELKAFLTTMDLLGDKLGPLLLQFRYYRKAEVHSVDGFLARLKPFLKTLPAGYRFVLEVRNRSWITEELLELLRSHDMALALTDHPWMEQIDELMERLDVATTDFTYIRWLGNRKKIEEQTKHWSKIVVDRRREMELWIPVIRRLLKDDIQDVFAFFNNHYAGFAPGSIQLFEEMWSRVG